MRYRFDRCQLDPPRHELSREGEPPELRPKVFSLLVLLVEERDRETLFERSWPGRVIGDRFR